MDISISAIKHYVYPVHLAENVSLEYKNVNNMKNKTMVGILTSAPITSNITRPEPFLNSTASRFKRFM